MAPGGCAPHPQEGQGLKGTVALTLLLSLVFKLPHPHSSRIDSPLGTDLLESAMAPRPPRLEWLLISPTRLQVLRKQDSASRARCTPPAGQPGAQRPGPPSLCPAHRVPFGPHRRPWAEREFAARWEEDKQGTDTHSRASGQSKGAACCTGKSSVRLPGSGVAGSPGCRGSGREQLVLAWGRAVGDGTASGSQGSRSAGRWPSWVRS